MLPQIRSPGMRLGVFGLNSGATFRPDDTARLVRRAEEMGYESVWAGEHVVVPSPRVAPSPMEPTDPILDPLVHLGFVAACSDSLLLGTGIIILPQRNPLVLAKQAASLDVLSGGRLLLGVGAGYLEPELTALRVPLSERGRRTDDYLAAMRALWSQPGPVSFTSPSVSFAGVDAHPRPVSPGGPRIVVGGHTRGAFRRAVAQGHGWYGFALTAADAQRCADGLRHAAEETTRPVELGVLEISVTPNHRLDAAAVEGFATAGVSRLIVNLAGTGTPLAAEERMYHAVTVLG
jgi:probable F420-dependent oxidoreductase